MSDRVAKGQDRVTNPPSAEEAFRTIDLYPDAQSLLTTRQSSIEEVIADCLIVLDASILLAPYEFGATNLEELRKVYERLAQEKRLVVPGQAAREFYKNRGNKLVATINKLSSALAAFRSDPLQERIPLLEGDEGYGEARVLSAQRTKDSADLVGKLQEIIKRLRIDVGQDVVSVLYQATLNGCVRDISYEDSDREALLADLERRTRLRLPPGFKDASKDDGGIGDLIIWKTILQIGSETKKDCIFVTNEEKTDWWLRANGPFQINPELLDEYKTRSGGRSVHLLPLSRLLKLFEVAPEVVETVKKSEDDHRSERERSAASALRTRAASEESSLQFLLDESEKDISRLYSEYETIQHEMEDLASSKLYVPAFMVEDIDSRLNHLETRRDFVLGSLVEAQTLRSRHIQRRDDFAASQRMLDRSYDSFLRKNGL